MHEKSNTFNVNVLSIAAHKITNKKPTPLKNSNGNTSKLGDIKKETTPQITVKISIPI